MSRRRSSAFVASFGLFFQLLVAGFHIPPALAIAGLASAPASFDTPFRTIVICTSTGLQTITLDDNNQPVEGNTPSSGGGSSCPICQSLSGDALRADGPPLVSRIEILARTGPVCQTHQRDEVRPLAALPRGPPRI